MPLDPAFAGLLADPRMALREPPAHIALDVIREAANAFMSVATGPRTVAIEEFEAPGNAGPIRVRLYRGTAEPGLPAILFLHGGGFILGNLDTHDALCRALAVHARAAVLAVDYRLVPEAHFPDPIDDCVAALDWLVREAPSLHIDPKRIAIVGDSAGANLAIATTKVAKDHVTLRSLGLFYPLIDPSCSTASQREFADGYMLTHSFIAWCWRLYASPSTDRPSTLYDLTRIDILGFPPTAIITAQYDPLRDEGEAFGARLRAAEVPVTISRYDGMIHGFAGFPHMTPRADQAIAEVARACRDAFAMS